VDAIDKSEFYLIEKVEPAGAGYINFYVDFSKFSALTFNSIKQLDQSYGYIKTAEPKKIIVEHTSVNPLHPIILGKRATQPSAIP
jgi:arginyl-tRNA synthetase